MHTYFLSIYQHQDFLVMNLVEWILKILHKNEERLFFLSNLYYHYYKNLIGDILNYSL